MQAINAVSACGVRRGKNQRRAAWCDSSHATERQVVWQIPPSLADQISLEAICSQARRTGTGLPRASTPDLVVLLTNIFQLLEQANRRLAGEAVTSQDGIKQRSSADQGEWV